MNDVHIVKENNVKSVNYAVFSSNSQLSSVSSREEYPQFTSWEVKPGEFLKIEHIEATGTNALSISSRHMHLPLPSLKALSLIIAAVAHTVITSSSIRAQ